MRDPPRQTSRSESPVRPPPPREFLCFDVFFPRNASGSGTAGQSRNEMCRKQMGPADGSGKPRASLPPHLHPNPPCPHRSSTARPSSVLLYSPSTPWAGRGVGAAPDAVPRSQDCGESAGQSVPQFPHPQNGAPHGAAFPLPLPSPPPFATFSPTQGLAVQWLPQSAPPSLKSNK